MKISQLMIIGMFALFLIFAIYGTITFDLSIQEMKKFLGTRNEGFAFNMMQGLDQSIEKRLADFQFLTKSDEVQRALLISNVVFELQENEINSIPKSIDENPIGEADIIPFIKEVADEELSAELFQTIQFYKDEYVHDVIEELYVTNAFGANVAFGIGTSDYIHDNEEWWQITKNNGLYIGELKFHENYGNYGKAFGFKIVDNEGNFLGVLRVLLTLDDMLNDFIDETSLINIPNRNVILLDEKGRIIYSNGTKNFENSETVTYFDEIQNAKNVGYFELVDDVEEVQLISFAKSTGYKSFEGFDWTVLVEQKSSSIVDEFVGLRNSIVWVSIIGMGSSVVIGIVISFFITNPLRKLSKLAKSIAKGDFNVKAPKSKISELEVISQSFNDMSKSLKKLIETEKQLAEANARIKNERLTAIGEVAASMAHNMKNPLATIKSSIDIVKRESLGKKSEIDEVLQRMDRAMSRMSHQLEGVLNFVRTTPLESKIVSVKSLLDSSIESLEIPKNITIEIPETSLQIKCDSKKMEIVFINLILNAMQEIGNKIGKITIRCKEEGNFVYIEFEDSGHGIPEEMLSMIFDPLVTTKEKGTGLGLSSSKNIVSQHGGTISVKNNPTVFTVKLPKT